ncbi:chromosome partitioning protein ParA [Methylobacterium sp. PvR107]|uniref:chromosome partitioning protein ParA n=1 Tax=Methylobacterium sp. PvR107 TaxID=2806597 RepID=UPI001AE6A215|nr:chromosome partitioning protein ParA [Methylobacterium sp. PvR107]MBP1179367.1 crescentin [Methylobacterium sp. PvR107]
MAWSPFRNGLFPADRSTETVHSDIPTSKIIEAPVAAAHLAAAGELSVAKTNSVERNPLDAIGQRDELLRMRVSEMSSRLEELKSLQDDFSSVLTPLIAISEELPRATMRLAEVEALFAMEQQSALAARREVSELTVKTAALASDLATTTAEVARLESGIHSRDIELEQLRVTGRDKGLAAENFERQLVAEVEQTKAFSAENKALRLEAHAADQALSRSERDLAEARERLAILDQDNRRLQLLCEDQEGRLAEAAVRYDSLREEAENERQRLLAIEADFAAESAARQKSDAQYEAEIGALRTERASLTMKLEAATNRANATEQLLAQLRAQLREKDEAHRASERAAKEAAIERITSDRRVEAVQADLARQTERLLEAQRLRSELDNRCDMLTKALAAKDVAVEQATSRATTLSDRIDQLSHRHAAELHELEVSNRRLVEDLQSERSERALMQGALDIARESRVTLQKQHEALKRDARKIRGLDGVGPVPDLEHSAAPTKTGSEALDNIRPFLPPERAS